MKGNNNNNRLLYAVFIAASLVFGQVAQAGDLVLGGDQTINTDTTVDDVYLGYFADGSLTVEGGATTLTSSASYFGWGTGYTGIATVNGSHWMNSSSFLIGYSSGGNGMLNIENNGVVTSTGGYIGYGSGSIGTVTVDGMGSNWFNSSSLFPRLYRQFFRFYRYSYRYRCELTLGKLRFPLCW